MDFVHKLTSIAPYILLCCWLANSAPANGQGQASISGFIRDAKSGETLIAANIIMPALSRGASSNNSGFYNIVKLKAGTFSLVATYIGYKRFKATISLEAGENKRFDIELEPSTLTAEELIIEGERPLEEEKAIGLATVSSGFIKEVPALLEADLFRSIQVLPGIKAASDFSSGLYIRGGSPDQTLILLDRTTVYNPSHFFGFFSTFNSDAIKDVKIFKGGYPAEYGGRLGAVIDIFNKDGNRKEFQGRASLGLLASRLNIEGPFSKGSWMLAARRSTLEPLLNVMQESVDNIPETFYFYDVNGKINYDLTPNDKLNLAFYSGRDKVIFPFAEDARFELLYGNQTLSTNWQRIFSKKLFSVFTFTASHYFNRPRIELSNTPIRRENLVTDFSAKGDFEYIASDSYQLKTGFWTGKMILTINENFDNQETMAERTDATYSSGYVEQIWNPSQQWTLRGGVRGNHFSAGNYFRLEPRLSLEHKYTSDVLFQLAYGRYSQFLTLITNEAFTGFDTWLTVGDGVPPAWGDQVVFGLKSRLTPSISFDFEIYYRTMRDLFELDPRLPDVAGLAYEELFRYGRGHAYGAEFFLEKRQGRLSGFVGYTRGTSRRKFPGYNDNKFYPPKHDRIHDINLVANYRLSPKWRLTSAFNYASGQAITDVTGNYAVNLPTSSFTRHPFVVGDLNGARLPAYHRIDVGITRAGSLFSARYQLQLQIINALSRRNIWFYSYNLDDNPITREAIKMLPLIPNISLTVDF